VRGGIAHLVQRLQVRVADVVAAEVVAGVVLLAGRAAIDPGLLLGLDALGAGEQAPAWEAAAGTALTSRTSNVSSAIRTWNDRLMSTGGTRAPAGIRDEQQRDDVTEVIDAVPKPMSCVRCAECWWPLPSRALDVVGIVTGTVRT
jgi:hypothetical protein